MADDKGGPSIFADRKLRLAAIFGAIAAVIVIVLILVLTGGDDEAPAPPSDLSGGPRFGGAPAFGPADAADDEPAEEQDEANPEEEPEPAAATWSLDDLDPTQEPFLVVAPEPLVLVAPPDESMLPGERLDAVPPPAGHNASTFRVVAEPRGPDPSTLPEVELPVGFSVPDRLADGTRMRYHASGWPLEIVCEADGSLMVFVPGGDYVRGTNDGPPEEGPEHLVRLSPFYIDRYEVTLDQYLAYLGNRPLPQEIAELGLSGRHPVVGVTYQEAIQYARWADKSLPTEAQWEAAARGPRGLMRPWLGRPLWERPREPGQLDPVGTYRMDRSALGCMDMAGNAREWCFDPYAPDAYEQALARVRSSSGEPGVVFNPRGPSGSTARVVRGGADDWRLTWRGSAELSERPTNVGLRLVLNLPEADAASEDASE